MCGAISQYNASEPPPGPRNMNVVVGKRLTLRGFIVTDHGNLMPDFVREVGAWLSEGRIHHRETVVEGLENAPSAFIGLLRGHNTGKMVVKL
jgi:NADPH-dependent curcumin reductase CurA